MIFMRLKNNFPHFYVYTLGCLMLLLGATPSFGQTCVADFDYTVSSNNLTVNFTNTSTGTVSGTSPNTTWDFGDGTTATTYDAIHTYSNSGTYTPCLLISDPITNCQSVFCDSITVPNTTTNPCQFTINYTTNGLDVALDLQAFDPSMPQPDDVTWYINTAGIPITLGTGVGITATLPAAGTYEICADYLVTGTTCGGVICETITVTDPSTPPSCYIDFTSTISDSIGIFEVLSTSASTPFDIITWNIQEPNGSAGFGSGSPFTYIFPTSGNYEVCVFGEVVDPITNTITCGADTCQTISVNLPSTTCTYDITAIVNNSTVNLELFGTGSSPMPTIVEWYSPTLGANVLLGTGNVLTYTFPSTTSGTYDICASYEAGACVGTECTSVVISPSGGACDYAISYTTNGLDVVLELNATTPNSMTPDSIYWNWVDPFVAVPLGNGSPIQYTAPAAGTYNICAEYTIYGTTCFGTICEQITVVDPNPPTTCNIDFAYTLSDSLGIFEVINNDPTVPTFNNISWTFAGGNGIVDSGTGSPFTYVFPVPGTYDVCVVGEMLDAAGNILCSADTCQTINVTFSTLSCAYAVLTTTNNLTVNMDLGPSPNSPIPNIVEWYSPSLGTGIQLGTGMSATYTFPAAGTYDICAEYEVSGTTCIGTECTTVTVTGATNPPTCYIDFVSTISDSIGIFEVLSTSASTPFDIITWNIVGPNGTQDFGSGDPFTYVFPTSGNYDVCVFGEIFDANNNIICSADTCQTITVNIPNNTSCDYGIAYTTNGFDVVLELVSNTPGTPLPNIIDWFWVDPLITVPLGSGSPLAYTAPNAGTYNICAEYEIPGTTCSGTVCETITVTDPNPQNCTIGFNYTITSDSIGIFEVINSGSTAPYNVIDWSITSSNGIQANGNGSPFTYIFPSSDLYQVCVSGALVDAAGNIVCTADTCQYVQVNVPNPTPCNYTIAANVNDLTVDFELLGTASSPVPNIIEWYANSFGVSLPLGTGNPLTYTFPAAGTYDVCADYEVTGTTCTGTICTPITVTDPVPSACSIDFTYTMVNDSIAIFEASPDPTTGLVYDIVEWVIQGGTAGNQSTGLGSPFTYVFPTSGTYNVCVLGTLLNADGTVACQADMCTIVPVNIPNPAPCVVDFNYAINPNNVGTFEIIPLPALSLNYTNVQWVITGNGSSATGTGTPFNYAFNAPGTYQVCVIADIVDMGGTYICTADECKTITVGPVSNNCDAFFEAQEITGTTNPTQVEFINLSTGNYTDVFWTFGDGTTSTDASPSFVHDYANLGVYQVCLTVWDNLGCQDNYCGIVYVSGTPACDYAINVTATNSVVEGEFISIVGGTPSPITWYEATTNVQLGTDSTFTYTFSNPGSYEICVDYGIAGSVCSGTLCENVTISNPICATTDCVFPGDADYDQVANNFDLLPIGLHFGQAGTARPNATTGWYGQPAPDWSIVQDNGINAKHVDCDGDGTVSFDDVDAIIQNYNRTHDGIQATNFGLNAGIYLDFAVDTVIFSPNSTAAILITADVMMGTNAMPAEDIYGVAFTLNYPSALVEMNTVDMQYDGMSWFGNPNQTIDLAVDLYDQGNLDLAFTRIDQNEVTGFGKIATVSFVVTDNITGKAGTEIPFTITASDIKVINGQGNILPFDATGGTVTILVEDINTSITPIEESNIKVFPNPTSTVLNIELAEASKQQITLFNALGQTVYTTETRAQTLAIPVEKLTSGIYLLNVQGENDSQTFKILIE